jgi:EF-P beta-lysylation protein EpmB
MTLSLIQSVGIPLWKKILRTNFTCIQTLADFLELSKAQREQLVQKPKFVLNLPLRLAQKITKGTLDDPLLRQFVPLQEELIDTPEFKQDPVCDESFRKEKKLLQKYEGRALLLCTSACAMHCRYCFRQNFPYETQDKLFDEELEWIRQDLSIHEVILSGGDPLSLSHDKLASLLLELAKMPHVRRIRFHTRFPIGIPERIDQEFLDLIACLPQQIYFVIHCNHPHELDYDIFMRLKALQKLGCVILNQSVLLKGVNDDVKTLKMLSEQLVNAGVLPYYLHQLDRVKGAVHFEVSPEKGRLLIKEMAQSLAGYAVPKYVQEIAGELNKTPL